MKGKTFGFRTITFLVVANMIGAGVFTTSGFAIADLASPHLVLIAWFVGGGLAITGAVSYGMLIRVMPESGGEYLFLSRAAHPLLGFIAGWVSLIAGFSGAIAYAASAFVQYAVPDDISISPQLDRILGIAAIVLAGLCHGIRPRVGAYAQNGVVFAKLWLLVGILVMAMWHWSNHAWPGFTAPLLVKPPIESAGLFAATLVWISLSYAGFNAAVYVAEEVQDAERIIPKALLVGTILVTLIYVLLNATFVYSVPATMIQGQEDVAAIVARVLGGSWFEGFVRITIAACLFTSVISMMMAAPRVYAKMADDGLLPEALRFQGEAPLFATCLQVALASMFVWISSLQDLLSYLGLTLSLSSACTVACLFLPRVRAHCPVGKTHIWPAIYVAGTLLIATMMVLHKPMQILATLATFLVGAVLYIITRWSHKTNADN